MNPPMKGHKTRDGFSYAHRTGFHMYIKYISYSHNTFIYRNPIVGQIEQFV